MNFKVYPCGNLKKGENPMAMYSISDVAEKMGVAPSALRYYDQEGLLPFVGRVNGRRMFKDEDFAWLRVINCLKNTGMPIKEIRHYIDLCREGDAKLQERYDIMLKQKQAIQAQLDALTENMKEIDYKVWYYKTALAAGTEAIHRGHPCNPSFEPDQIK